MKKGYFWEQKCKRKCVVGWGWQTVGSVNSLEWCCFSMRTCVFFIDQFAGGLAFRTSRFVERPLLSCSSFAFQNTLWHRQDSAWVTPDFHSCERKSDKTLTAAASLIHNNSLLSHKQCRESSQWGVGGWLAGASAQLEGRKESKAEKETKKVWKWVEDSQGHS